ncbi:MAG: FprA family A-type flavoprotein [Desulfurococcales archaeon]|nr:FprA family A-type flavoprotein [Desulfurococcales archaeon]
MVRKLHRPLVVVGNENHKFIWLGLDEADAEKGILTNQYLIVHNGEGILLDPGGYFVFQKVLEAVSKYLDPSKVKAIFYSHQDPDVVGSINLLLDFFPNANIYISALWTRFLPHLGAIADLNIIEIPDNGNIIEIGGVNLEAVPAHFLHSPGNFTLYDHNLRVLFSGDIGAAVFPKDEWYLFVDNFDKHLAYIEGFHKRYLCCKKALDYWLSRVKDLNIEVLAPQHGAIFQGPTVSMFLKWLSTLEKIGIDIMYD